MIKKITHTRTLIFWILLQSPVFADSDVDSFIIEIETLMDQGVEIRQQYNFDNKLDKQRCASEKSQLKTQGKDLLVRINEAEAVIPADLKQAARSVQSCIECNSSDSGCDRTRSLLERVKEKRF